MHCIVLYNTLSKINSFSIIKAKAMLPLIKQISKKESLNINALNKKNLAFNRRDPASIDKAVKMLHNSENIKKSDIRHIFSKNKYTTFCWSRSKIRSI